MADWELEDGMDEVTVRFTDPRPPRVMVALMMGGFVSTFLFFALQQAALGALAALTMVGGFAGLVAFTAVLTPRVTLRVTPTTLHAKRWHPWSREISGPLDTVSMAVIPVGGVTSTATIYIGGHALHTGPHRTEVLESFAARLERHSAAASERLGDLDGEVPAALRDVARTSERER